MIDTDSTGVLGRLGKDPSSKLQVVFHCGQIFVLPTSNLSHKASLCRDQTSTLVAGLLEHLFVFEKMTMLSGWNFMRFGVVVEQKL